MLAKVARIAHVEHDSTLQRGNVVVDYRKTFVTEWAMKSAISEDAESTLMKVQDRHIKESVRYFLWGRSAGRCEFDGCNELLWKSSLTQEDVNLAEAGHIYSFNAGGPRGNNGIRKAKINDAENLLLVCRACHKTIDASGAEYRYSVRLLQRWKHDHEARVELVTGIKPEKKSHLLLYGAAIGNVETSLDFHQAATALFPRRYPSSRDPIKLGEVAFADKDHDPGFWQTQRKHLEKRFQQRVAEKLEEGEITHVSLFALAPQPLLIVLGSLLVDLVDVDVYQRHREPIPSWNWPASSPEIEFVIRPPEIPDRTKPPALLLSLSATVSRDRLEATVGKDLDIWEVTTNHPNNDLIKSPSHLSAFRATLRPLFDQIKFTYGQTVPLHIFPIAPVSCNVELGRIRMPKAHQSWHIYDQNNRLGGFVHALTIGDEHS